MGEQRPAKPGRRHSCRPARLLLTPRKEERSRHCRKEKPAQRELGQLQSGPPENGALRIGLGEDVGPVRHAEQRAVHCISAQPRHAVEEIALQNKPRSEEHTSELQSLMRISYAVFCLKKNTPPPTNINTQDITPFTTTQLQNLHHR